MVSGRRPVSTEVLLGPHIAYWAYAAWSVQSDTVGFAVTYIECGGPAGQAGEVGGVDVGGEEGGLSRVHRQVRPQVVNTENKRI